MHHKAIKAQIRKQLKTRYSNWDREAGRSCWACTKNVIVIFKYFLHFTDDARNPAYLFWLDAACDFITAKK